MSQSLYPPLLTHPSLNLIVLNLLDDGSNQAPCQGNVWFPPTSISSTILPALMSHPLRIKCSPTRHTSGLILLCSMASSRSLFYLPAPFNSPNLSHSYAVCSGKALLVVISGVDEGYAQGIPWESLPLIRGFVKERLALAAFLNCICSSRAIGPSWHSVLGFATNDF